MSEEQVPNTIRRSARIAERRERATQVSLRDSPIADATMIEKQSDGQVITATGSITLGTSDHSISSNIVIGSKIREPEYQCTLGLYQQPVPCEIRYFRQYRDPMSLRQINEAVKRLLINDEDYARARTGHVYCFEHPANHDIDDGLGPEVLTAIHPIKIGRARSVPNRMRGWRVKCQYEPRVLFHYRMPQHERIEAIVHAQLYNERRKEHLGCCTCGSRHDEWFDTHPEHARGLVRLWQGFTTHSLSPYDESGYLVPQWRERLQHADMNAENCWAWFTGGDPNSRPLPEQAEEIQACEAGCE